MDILLFNLGWMAFNILLALIPVVFGYSIFNIKNRVLKILYFLIWLFFIPNTIYIITDIFHFPRQWMLLNSMPGKIILFGQYLFLETAGLITFIISVYFMEKWVLSQNFKNKKFEPALVIGFNFLIAFGVVLGRIQRTNSWEVITNLQRVTNDTIQVLTSQELILLVIVFGFFENITYFTFSKKIIHFIKKYLNLEL